MFTTSRRSWTERGVDESHFAEEGNRGEIKSSIEHQLSSILGYLPLSRRLSLIYLEEGNLRPSASLAIQKNARDRTVLVRRKKKRASSRQVGEASLPLPGSLTQLFFR